MGRYIIKGGNPLEGELTINGSKNAALPILSAAILNKGESIIHNCPNISDVNITLEILKNLGCKIKREEKTIIVNSSGINNYNVEDELVKQMRSSIIFLGALLGSMHVAKISYPGGCKIGARPIDMHLKALRLLGADIKEENGFIHCSADKLVGTSINLDFPSVGATENIILASVYAQGETVIYNAAREPEIVDLQNFINSMGGDIKGAGTDTVTIKGISKLNNTEYRVMSDRIEAGTFLTAAAMCGGKIFLKKISPEIIRQPILRLCETGCKIKEYNDGILLSAPQFIAPIDTIRTIPYPGFPTDLQPQFMSLLTLAKGTSIIIETVFESRLKHVLQLCKMGADISILEERMAVIKGVEKLKSSYLSADDLRGGAGLIIAALSAEGESIVENSEYVERGYENIEASFKAVGGKIILDKVLN